MDSVKLIASEMEEGENRYLECPSCGRANKLSLSIIDGRGVYHCFRPNCKLNLGGAFNVNGSCLVRTKSAAIKKDDPYEGELSYLTQEWNEYLEEQVGFKAAHNRIGRYMLAVKENRIAYPVFSPRGRRRGYVLRCYHGSKTKTLTRMDTLDDPHMSWYKTHGDGQIVVVEDIPSAIRVAKYASAVALCGTGCGVDYIQEIAASTRSVVWALDADVLGYSIALHRKYGILFQESRVLPIPKDFKDMTDTEIEELLDE